MASQSPLPAAPAAEIKVEENAIPERNATELASGTPAPGTPAPAGLTKQDYEVMSKLLVRLVDFKDKEYSCHPPAPAYSQLTSL